MTLAVKSCGDGVVFSVKVVPGSSRTRVAGLYGSALKVNVAAPPEKGKANKELTQVLARWLDCPAQAVAVVAGHTQAHKEVQVRGLSAAELQRRLERT